MVTVTVDADPPMETMDAWEAHFCDFDASVARIPGEGIDLTLYVPDENQLPHLLSYLTTYLDLPIVSVEIHTEVEYGELVDSSDVHVTPTADLVVHNSTSECCCGPTCEPVKREDGSVGYVYTHHSLDGREAHE